MISLTCFSIHDRNREKILKILKKSTKFFFDFDNEKIDWIEENCNHAVYYDYAAYYFTDDNEAMLFKLRWDDVRNCQS